MPIFYLKVDALQYNIKPLNIQNCVIRNAITFNPPSAKCELIFTTQQHKGSINIKTGISRG